MQIDQALTRAAVIGAAGKMGSGIALLLLQEMTLLAFRAKVNCHLNLIDANEDALSSLKKYLREQMIRYAEKSINKLRILFASESSLVSNQEIIDAFVNKAFEIASFGISIEEAKRSHLVFEAIVEEVDAKIQLFKSIKNNSNFKPYFFTNTSSIPIHLLNQQADLDNHIVGFHFYNPPAVQQLVELIYLPNNSSALKALTIELAKRFKKITVESNDIAGFIGNGHFAREILYACRLVDEMDKDICYLNQITEQLLIRPMGIFQLIDYVGIEVCQNILRIMKTYLPDAAFEAPLLSKIKGKKFFEYAKGQIVGVYCFEKQEYVPIKNRNFGSPPSWKSLVHAEDRSKILNDYLEKLFKTETEAADIAKKFLVHSLEIGKSLVATNVAHSLHDVDTVLKNGFFHLYGLQEIERLNI